MLTRCLILMCLLSALVANASAKAPVTIYLAGDSTMAKKLPEKRPETGWGEALPKFFKDGSVRIENRAQNGRSTRTFIEQGLWQGIVNDIRKGDYVLIEFGHNDSAKDKPDRYTPPEDYRANLARFVREARGRGATPVLLTPVVRRRFDKEGRFQESHGVYTGIVREVAARDGVALIDMYAKSEKALVGYGPDESRRLFLQLKPGENPNYPAGVEDNTHFNPLGADLMAGLAVEGIREQKLGLAKYLLKPGAASQDARAAASNTATVKRDEARFTLAVPQRSEWRWHLKETRDRAREYMLAVRVSNAGKEYSFGLYVWKYPNSSPGSGGLSSLIAAGQKSLFERSPFGHVIIRDAGVSVGRDGDQLVITVKGKKNVARLFSDRPAQVAFETQMPGEPTAAQTVPITYVD